MTRKDAIYEMETDLMDLSLTSTKAAVIAGDLADRLGDSRCAALDMETLQTYAEIVADYARSVTDRLNLLLDEISNRKETYND